MMDCWPAAGRRSLQTGAAAAAASERPRRAEPAERSNCGRHSQRRQAGRPRVSKHSHRRFIAPLYCSQLGRPARPTGGL